MAVEYREEVSLRQERQWQRAWGWLAACAYGVVWCVFDYAGRVRGNDGEGVRTVKTGSPSKV
jgi:hypothetical protein